jgi:hypothetical protein
VDDKYIYFEFLNASSSLASLRKTILDTAGNQGFIFSYVKKKIKTIYPERTHS